MIKSTVAVVLLLACVLPVNRYAAPIEGAPASSHKHVSETAVTEDVAHADIHLMDPDEKREVLESRQGAPLSFESLNGVSVLWTKEELLGGKGMPSDMKRDELFGTVELEYRTVTVGWYGDGIDYLIVPADAGTVNISGTELPMTYTALRLALGKPDYEAEDGLVYERDGLCLKLFLKPGNGAAPKLESVQVYWSATV